jgi:hypothetical protein
LNDVGRSWATSSLELILDQSKEKPMADAAKQKFLVLYLIPASVMADWAKTDPAIRQPEEQKMQAAWRKW